MYSKVVATLLFLIPLALFVSGVGGFMLLSVFVTPSGPTGEGGSGDILRLAYFALMFLGSLAILIRVASIGSETMRGKAPVHLYMREAAIYGAVMLAAVGTSCWLISEWSRGLVLGGASG